MITQRKWKIHREVLNSPQPEYIYGGPDNTHICDFRELNPCLIDEVLKQQRDNAALIVACPTMLDELRQVVALEKTNMTKKQIQLQIDRIKILLITLD